MIADVYQMPTGDWGASAGWPCVVTDGFSTEIQAWMWIVEHYEKALAELKGEQG